MTAAILFLSLFSPTIPSPAREPKQQGEMEQVPPPVGSTRPEEPAVYVPFLCRSTLFETEDERLSYFVEMGFPDLRPSMGIRSERYLGNGFGLRRSLELHGSRLAAPMMIYYWPCESLELAWGIDFLGGGIRRSARLAF